MGEHQQVGTCFDGVSHFYFFVSFSLSLADNNRWDTAKKTKTVNEEKCGYCFAFVCCRCVPRSAYRHSTSRPADIEPSASAPSPFLVVGIAALDLWPSLWRRHRCLALLSDGNALSSTGEYTSFFLVSYSNQCALLRPTSRRDARGKCAATAVIDTGRLSGRLEIQTEKKS